jgi:hypothetical protein
MLPGFIVSKRGIEANPEKISAIMNKGPIRDLKGVQWVTRMPGGAKAASSHASANEACPYIDS